MTECNADRAKQPIQAGKTTAIEYVVTAEQYGILVDLAGDMSVQAYIDAVVQAHAAQQGKRYPTSTRRGATGKGRRKKSA